ncbi:MAG: hypothetical protein KDB80_18310, partial [Planctomycetes bacterium]|nr:hypothetical protein [Planctomycetota bacterium]
MTPSEKIAGWREGLVLLALGLALFLPAACAAEFLNFDDDFFFGARNQAFVAGGVAHLLDPTATIANAYLPVSHLSLYADWCLFGTNPIGAHVHSLLLHVLGAFVLARLLGRLGVGRVGATLVAAVFLAHPALVESVAWVASRKDVLAGLFSFLCLSAVARVANGEPRQRWWAIAFAVLALYSKATTVVLPLVATLILWRAKPRRIGLIAGLFGVTLLAGLHHTVIAASEGTLVTQGMGTRASHVPGVFWHYFCTTIWPFDLNVLYPEVLTHASFGADLWPGVMLVVGIAVVVVAFRRRRPWLAAGLAVWSIALLPFNTALPASAAAAADRYLYLAIPGAALALLGLGPKLGRVALAAALVLGVLGTSSRVRDFETSESLWSASLRSEPRNSVAHFNLAVAVLQRDPTALTPAEESLEAAVRVARMPQHRLHPELQLASVCESDGRVDAALEHMARAVEAIDELHGGPAVAAKRLDV